MNRLILVAALALSACASTTESNTGRTATEQLLLARAADRAAEGLILPIAQGSRIFVDDVYFRVDSGADAVFEIRAGALSLEQMRRVVGLPEVRVPINENLNVVSLPELSVYSRRDRIGVAEFSGFLYDARTGAPLGAVSPMIGRYRIRSHKALMIVGWGQQSAHPGERDPGSSWKEF